jgi:hypothetical protein
LSFLSPFIVLQNELKRQKSEDLSIDVPGRFSN